MNRRGFLKQLVGLTSAVALGLSVIKPEKTASLTTPFAEPWQYDEIHRIVPKDVPIIEVYESHFGPIDCRRPLFADDGSLSDDELRAEAAMNRLIEEAWNQGREL